MGDGGDEVATLAVDGGEVLGHPVEGMRQLADLVGRGRAHAARVVTPCHRAGDLGHLAQRGDHPSGQQLGDAQGERHGHREHEQRGDVGS